MNYNIPVIKNSGHIIGKNQIPLEQAIVKMLKQYGFNLEEAKVSLNQNKHNQITTVYYLLHKRYVMDGKLPCHFGITNKRGNSAEPTKAARENSRGPVNAPMSPSEVGYSPLKK